VRLVRIRYLDGASFDLHGAAEGALRSVLALPGIESPTHSISIFSVSGRPARRTMLDAHRFGGRLGAEFLQIYDPATNTTWQLQLIFGNPQNLSPFANKSLDPQRAEAGRVISGVTIAE
jgi:hypothetical protein